MSTPLRDSCLPARRSSLKVHRRQCHRANRLLRPSTSLLAPPALAVAVMRALQLSQSQLRRSPAQSDLALPSISRYRVRMRRDRTSVSPRSRNLLLPEHDMASQCSRRRKLPFHRLHVHHRLPHQSSPRPAHLLPQIPAPNEHLLNLRNLPLLH